MQLPEWLSHRLKEPLPGLEAQLELAPLGRREEIEKIRVPKDAKKSCVLLLLYPGANDWMFPLIQRPSYDGVHSGQIGLPGGKVEPTDPDYSFTALRETHEEIGIHPSEVNLIGQLSPIYIPPSRFWVQPFVGFLDHQPHFIPDNHEVAEILSAEAGIFHAHDVVKETIVTVAGGFKIQSKYYHVQDKVVWGATAMILSEFKAITKAFYNQ
jgi:8-oxo-dGTP pyrophosphatase MutT (NUDIX family)